MNEIEVKRDQLAKVMKLGLLGLFGFAIAPYAWVAITGIAGMFAFVGIVGLGAMIAPVLALKAANLKYRIMDAERVDHLAKVKDAAAENPVETLQLDYEAQVKAADAFSVGITEFRTEVKNYEDIVKNFEKDYPEDAAQGREQLALMKEGLQDRERIYAETQVNLDEYAKTIKKSQALWDLALATQRVNKLAGMNTGDVFAKIKVTAAVDSVRAKLNQSFAQMETATMVNRKGVPKPALTNNPQPVLTIDNVTQKVTV